MAVIEGLVSCVVQTEGLEGTATSNRTCMPAPRRTVRRHRAGGAGNHRPGRRRALLRCSTAIPVWGGIPCSRRRFATVAPAGGAALVSGELFDFRLSAALLSLA